MSLIESRHPSQVTFGCLEDQVCANNPVRIIDAFTEWLDLKRLPNGEAREEAITERIRLEYRLRVLNDRIDNYGAVALL